MKKKTATALWAVLLALSVQAQESSTTLDRISGKLDEALRNIPAEKISLQTDKDIYFPGEIIWFQSLVLDRSDNQLSGVSRGMNVFLYNGSGQMVTGDLFRVSDGRAAGDLRLPDDLLPGRYFLAAYTPLQTDPGSVVFKPLLVDRFYEGDVTVSLADPSHVYEAGLQADVVVSVSDYNGDPAEKFPLLYEAWHAGKKTGEGKTRSEGGKALIRLPVPPVTGSDPLELIVHHPRGLWSRKFYLRTSADRIMLTFYPEGNHLVGTSTQKMGYYVTAWNGVPVEIEGDILDEAGQLKGKTRTFLPGYGVFPYQGTPGSRERLVITSEYGNGQTFDLPRAEENPMALIVRKTDREFVTADILMAGQSQHSLSVTATRGYSLLWAAGIEISSSARIRIPVGEFGEGLVLLSVFDKPGNLRSSRMVYIPGTRELKLQIETDSSKQGNLQISILSTDESQQNTAARLAVSVADRMRIKELAEMPGAWYYLGGELVNPLPVLAPGSAESLLTEANLDYMLIGNEPDGFSWDKVLHPDEGINPGLGLPGMGVNGLATDNKGNPLPFAKVSVLNSKDMLMVSATADEAGRFSFPALNRAAIQDPSIFVTDERGKGNFTAVLDPSFRDEVGLKIRKADPVFAGFLPPRGNIASYLAVNPDLLTAPPAGRPVVTRAATPRVEPYKTMLQSSSSIMDAIRAIKPYTLVGGQIVFFGTTNSIYFQSGALIVIDGQKMGTQADVLNALSPHDVEEIHVSLDPMDIQKYTGLNSVGVIEITTKRGKSPDSPNPSPMEKEEIQYKDGYRVPRDFLTSGVLPGGKGKDLRTTLYWNPSLETGSGGALIFSIPLSEVHSDFVISATGVSADGTPGKMRVVYKAR